MEPKRSFPHLHVPATCPFPEPARPSPYHHIPLPEYSYFLAAVLKEPDLYRFLTFQVPNVTFLFRRLGCTKVSVQVRGFLCEHFVI